MTVNPFIHDTRVARDNEQFSRSLNKLLTDLDQQDNVEAKSFYKRVSMRTFRLGATVSQLYDMVLAEREQEIERLGTNVAGPSAALVLLLEQNFGRD